MRLVEPTRRRWVIAGVALGVSVVVGVALMAGRVTGPERMTACTLVGCESSVRFDVDGYSVPPGQRLEGCARFITLRSDRGRRPPTRTPTDMCHPLDVRTEDTRVRNQFGIGQPNGGARFERMSVRRLAPDGGVLSEMRVEHPTATVRQPNGPLCGPTCMSARVRLEKDGALVDAAPAIH